jgi:hypothetical protein
VSGHRPEFADLVRDDSVRRLMPLHVAPQPLPYRRKLAMATELVYAGFTDIPRPLPGRLPTTGGGRIAVSCRLPWPSYRGGSLCSRGYPLT